MTSKHPKRCSNHCVHETKSPFLYGWGCNAVRDDEGRPVNITVVEERLINKIGCALHSNHLELPDSCASHSSASEPMPEQMGDPWNCTDLGIECPDPEQDWCSWPCDKWWLLCHDAIIATKARAEVLSCVQEYVNDLTKEVAHGLYTNQGIFEELQKLSRRIESLRQQEEP